MIRLQGIEECHDSIHKYIATFSDGTKTKFGAKGYEDFTIHKDMTRRSKYIHRHKKDLLTNDPKRAGYLSMFILWNRPSLQQSIQDYKKRLLEFNKTNIFPTEIK